SSANFTDAGTIDACWTRDGNTFFDWVPRTGASHWFNTGPNSDKSGNGGYAMTHRMNFSSIINDVQFETPWIDMSQGAMPDLQFWYHMFGAQIVKLEVHVRKLNGGTSLLNTINGQQHTSKTDPWTQSTLSLNAYVGDTIQVIFKGYRTLGGISSSIAIDEVEVVNNICADPTNLGVSNIKGSSVDVSWNSVNGTSKLQYGSSGFTLGQGTIVNNVTSAHNLTGLTPQTTYDIYVKDSCGASNISQWVGPLVFTTTCDSIMASMASSVNYLNVQFDGTASMGTNLSYQWDFGDGNSAFVSNPTHTYATDNTYLVTLIVTDPCGNSDTITQNFQVCGQPLSTFTYSINGLTVNFNSSNSVGAVSYLWDLDNGGFNIIANPSVTYAQNGTYNVSLVITNACGDTDTSYQTIVICDKPDAFFSYKIISSGGFGMIVDFDGSLSQGVNSFQWNFGDGNVNTTSLTPTHTYNTPGLFYEVELITYSDCGTSDTMKYKLGDVVSVEEFDFGNASVYPNPASEFMTLELENRIEGELDLFWYNVLGQSFEVPTTEVDRDYYQFDVSALKPGNYILVLQNDQGQKTLKITIR
ncbi:MAG: PKD domain-containing protein, partial [Schleiferiaceae bacterium]|nr:PKD domain-containing protein [Schleiferiaceae bacterium]